MRVCVTGGTGFLGRQVLRLIANDCRVTHVVAIARGRTHYPHPKIQVACLDLSQPGSLDDLPCEFDAIIHLAGAYDFAHGYGENYLGNIVTTMHLLAWAGQAKKPPKIHHASTYVVNSGAWHEAASEKPVDVLPTKKQAYAHTKAVAENLVLASGLPHSIYRLGVLVGDTHAGRIEKVDGPYYLMRFLQSLAASFLKSKIPQLPFFAPAESLLPLVPVNTAAAVLCEGLFFPTSENLIFGVYHTGSVSLSHLVVSALARFELAATPFFFADAPPLFQRMQCTLAGLPAPLFDFTHLSVRLNNPVFSRCFGGQVVPHFESYEDPFFSGFKEFRAYEDQMVQGKTRQILNIDLLRTGLPTSHIIVTNGSTLHIEKHRIGWDFECAKALIKAFDGKVDAIAFSGVSSRSPFKKFDLVHKPSEQLINSVKTSAVYSGQSIRQFFADWTLSCLMRNAPNKLKGNKILLHFALMTPGVERMEAAGAVISCADLLTVAGIPLQTKGVTQLARRIRLLKPFLENLPPRFLGPDNGVRSPMVQSRLRSWIRQNDVFFTFQSMLGEVGSFEILEGKTLIIDVLDEKTEASLKAAGVGRIVRLMPELPLGGELRMSSFSVLHAIIDQLRDLENSPTNFDEYLLNFIESHAVKPSHIQFVGNVVNRCAFIVHPLSRHDIMRAPQFRWVGGASESAQGMVEHAMSYLPTFHLGRIDGIKSASSGQEVVCEVYAMPATPKQMLRLDENFVYNRLVAAAEQARKNGCSIIGLGAYTKVIGDAGITVASRASLPVTNGNSYSAASTLWAAREMLEKMRFVAPAGTGMRLKAKAMVIGATGSIGRVSSHLLSFAVSDLVLVATRPERLLEMRDEVSALNPHVRVHITTDANSEISDCDLIVTATSNQSGRILNIDLVKPGAVICDCSRPLDVTAEEAARRPDVMVIESGEIILPGSLRFGVDIGLPQPSVYACLAETALLCMEGRLESFSLGKELSLHKVKEIYKLGLKHGAKLSEIRGPFGSISEDDIERCRERAILKLKTWKDDQELFRSEKMRVRRNQKK